MYIKQRLSKSQESHTRASLESTGLPSEEEGLCAVLTAEDGRRDGRLARRSLRPHGVSCQEHDGGQPGDSNHTKTHLCRLTLVFQTLPRASSSEGRLYN